MPSFLLTIDVEDWFQVENLRPWMPFSTWDSRDLRVEANVHKLLDLFDGVKLNASNPECINPENPVNPVGKYLGPARSADSTDAVVPPTSNTQPSAVKKVRCTFFTLGWIAKRLPHLVREIAARGHEVASHGSSHQMCSGLAESDLRSELAGSKQLLEDITGAEVAGFRAPNFSIDDRVLTVLQESGYRYDSSYNNFSLHGRYGKINLDGNRVGIAHRIADDFIEIPVSNLSFRNPLSFQLSASSGKRNGEHGFVLPWGGGAYFRLMPLSMFTMGVRSILKKEGAYIFYMHPWEIDPGQPRVGQASLFSRFKHYKNIETTEAKLKMMIERFADYRFVACKNYINDDARLTVQGKWNK
jgi:polysaccharide deacetylase family protein (PEP-CTERM system associated)